MAKAPSRLAWVALCLVLLAISVQIGEVEGRVHVVGGRYGWGILNYQNWCRSTRFKAGDILIFKFDSTIHEVAEVGYKEYQSCRKTSRSPVYKNGYKRFVLKRGWNYYMCTKPGHCQVGMKLAIRAT